MTNIAIVGINGMNLDEYERNKIMAEIMTICKKYNKKKILSLKNPRGGVSTFVELYAKEFKIDNKEYDLGENLKDWKEGNKKMVKECDILYCLTTMVKRRSCYHCLSLDHEVSGGCFAMKEAKKLGKPVNLLIL